MKNKIIVTDLDGTLLNKEKVISQENIDSIKEFRRLGGLFTVATGRSLGQVKPLLRDIPIDLPLVLYNGAMIYDINKDEIIHTSYLTNEVINKSVDAYEELLKSYDLTLVGFGDGVVYLDEANTTFAKRLKNYVFDIISCSEMRGKKIIKFIIIGKNEDLKKATASFNGINHVFSESDLLEILPEETCKWNGIKKIIESHNLAEYKVYTFGDNHNDKTMLSEACVGIAMKNGCSEIFDHADCVSLSSNDESGVGGFIKDSIISKK